MRRHAVVAAAACFVPAALLAQAPPRTQIRGVVTGNGLPLAGARIYRAGGADTSRTDSTGHYSLSVGRGSYVFEVVHAGFEPIEMELNISADTAMTVDIPLQPLASANDKLVRVGFIDRRQRAEAAHSGATFLGPDELESRTVGKATALFDGVPGLLVRVDRSMSVVYGADGHCAMAVWIDGQRMDNVFPPPAQLGGGTSFRGGRGGGGNITFSGLDPIVQAADIAGVEIYPRPAMVPREFQRASTVSSSADLDTRSTDCGALIIWTRRG